MAKVTGTKKESSSKSNLKDILTKLKKLTPVGMTVEVAKKAAEKLKKDSNTIKDTLEEPAKKDSNTIKDTLEEPAKKESKTKRFPPFDKFDKKPKLERMPLPLNPNEQKTGVQYLSRGGRVMYGSGSKVKGCKLAKRGKGKAYGKNS